MMKAKIKRDMVIAMKEKNVVARDILRVLQGEMDRYVPYQNGGIELNDVVIIKLIKKLIESVKASGDDNGEIAVLDAYLPKQMSESEITHKVNEIINDNDIDSIRGMGLIMSTFKNKYEGTYDGITLSTIVKRILS